MCGYTVVRNERKNGDGRGVVIFVHREVRYKKIDLGKVHRSITVRFWTGKKELGITDYYNLR